MFVFLVRVLDFLNGVVRTKVFNLFFMLLIFFNTAVLSMEYHGMSSELEMNLSKSISVLFLLCYFNDQVNILVFIKYNNKLLF